MADDNPITSVHKNGCAGLMFAGIISVFMIIQMMPIGSSAGAQDGKRDLIMTPLYDNRSSNKDLKTGWGFSCLIQGAEKTVLFDIGSDDAIMNMEKLNINPASIDVLVISHDHSDHTAGMPAFLKINKKAKTIFVPRESVKICENVYTTGAMSTSDREHKPFTKGTLENALIIRTAKGLVILTGCAHPGIVEMVQRAKSLFPKESVYLVMGGFHLMNKSKKGVEKIVGDLKKENVRKVAPGHCTGRIAESVFKEIYGADCIALEVGKSVIIEGR